MASAPHREAGPIFLYMLGRHLRDPASVDADRRQNPLPSPRGSITLHVPFYDGARLTTSPFPGYRSFEIDFDFRISMTSREHGRPQEIPLRTAGGEFYALVMRRRGAGIRVRSRIAERDRGLSVQQDGSPFL